MATIAATTYDRRDDESTFTRSKNARRQRKDGVATVIVHLVDGTYELFRHFYGIRRGKLEQDPPLGAVAGVVGTILRMLEDGATHVGVATDHVIESFRNDLWPGYKTGDGIEPSLLAQFHPLEETLRAIGIVTWAMVELEADDALASAAHLAANDPRVQKVCIWTPDKDLAQCVIGQRVVQIDRKSGQIRDDQAVMAKWGVSPEHIPDYLALVGDAADGFPGLRGCGAKTAAKLIASYGHIEAFPPEVLGAKRAEALLFKTLATLRKDAPLFTDVDELRWRGPAAHFDEALSNIDARLVTRIEKLQGKR